MAGDEAQNLAERVDALEARLEITNLRSTYNFAVDQGHAELAASLFSEDGVLDIGPNSPRGRQELHAFFEQVASTAGVLHLVLNETIDRLGADEAEGRAYIVVLDRDSKETTMVATYLDRFRRTAEGWRFAERTLNPF